MNDTDKRSILINRLQIALYALRLFSGFTMLELSQKIGVTKQTISNLEKQKTSMSYTQYLALFEIFKNESEKQHNNFLLRRVMDILFGDTYSDDEITKMVNYLNSVAGESVVQLLNAYLDKSDKAAVFQDLNYWLQVPKK